MLSYSMPCNVDVSSSLSDGRRDGGFGGWLGVCVVLGLFFVFGVGFGVGWGWGLEGVGLVWGIVLCGGSDGWCDGPRAARACLLVLNAVLDTLHLVFVLRSRRRGFG